MSNSITQIITHTFLLSLAFGTQLFSPIVSTRLTGVGFYKLGNSIVLMSLILAFGTAFFMDPGLDTFSYVCFGILLLTNSLTSIFHNISKE